MRSFHFVSQPLTLSGKSWSLKHLMTTVPMVGGGEDNDEKSDDEKLLYKCLSVSHVFFSNPQSSCTKMFCRDPFFTTYPEVAFQEGSFDTTVHLNSFKKTPGSYFHQNKVDVLLGSNTQEGLLFTQVIF